MPKLLQATASTECRAHNKVASDGLPAVLVVRLLLGLLLLTNLISNLVAQEAVFQSIRVVPNAEADSGKATITDKSGKERVVASRAYQAFTIDGGMNALILTRTPHGKPGAANLLYVEGSSNRRRILGDLPFRSAHLTELKPAVGNTAFVLSGNGEHGAALVVADVLGIRGRAEGILRGQPTVGDISYISSQSGQRISATLDAFLGSDVGGIYRLRENNLPGQSVLQFLPDGTLVESSSSSLQSGRWSSDGAFINGRLARGEPVHWLRSDLVELEGVPASIRLRVRLLHPLASNKAKVGDPVSAVLISPGIVGGKTYLPQGSKMTGIITVAKGVGFGLRHETAALTVAFRKIETPDGSSLDIHARLLQVDNAQEKVDPTGKIRGIRATGTLGRSAETKIAALANFDPLGYLFTTASATAALGFAEPEILYPAGTELVVLFEAPLVTSKSFPAPVPALATSAAELAQLRQLVRNLPYRTATRGTNTASDVTNLVFIGPEDGIKRAFAAAGWLPADKQTTQTTFKTIRALAGNEVYREAPMSMLLLDERPPVFTFTKTTNTFSSRHHLRVFDPGLRFHDVSVYTSSSTQDIGIGFSKQKKTFIHLIDQYIDNERTKVENDLEFTGCVASAQLMDRPWVPEDLTNATGDKLRTDGAIAIMQVTDCLQPREASGPNVVPPGRVQRIFRDTVLAVRNEAYRGNLPYQAVTGSIQLRHYLAHKSDLDPGSGAWVKTDLTGTQFKGVTSSEGLQPAVASTNTALQTGEAQTAQYSSADHRWDPSRYEIALQAGYFRLPHDVVSGIGVLLTPINSLNTPVGIALLAEQFTAKWSVGVSLTLNTWRWISNEFAFQYQRGGYRYYTSSDAVNSLVAGLTDRQAGLVSRQTEYNVVIHLRPRESRLRPYVAVGPVLQLHSIDGATLQKPSAVFHLGLENVGLLRSAFSFGGTPPLEGGGIFQIGFQYGGGIKYRVHPRVLLRADFRETLARNPEFLRKSYTPDYFAEDGYTVDYVNVPSDGLYRQQRFTLGVAYTF